ncbi:MAG: FtsX-like permease family protein [Gemmatimonadetes bacterium]|nr:FtsX-like permease family protein [Gemmatimonadota bacterium]
MVLSYLRTSFRNLFRHRLYTLVNIFGLAVGMAACILVGLFLQHEFSYDAYHRDIDRIHRVMRLVHPSGGGLPYYPFGTQYRAGSTLVDELPEIEDMTHFITRPMWAGLEDRGFDVRGTVADPNFLCFFTYPLIDGSQPPELTPGSVYITESFAQKLFGTTDVVGRTLKIYYKWVEGDFYIGGILRDQPVATSGEFVFDLLISYEGIPNSAGPPWGRQWSPTTRFLVLKTFVRLAPDATLSSLRPKLHDFARRHLGNGADPRDTYDLMPLRRQHLYARRDFQLHMDVLDQQDGLVQGDINRCYTFGLVGAIILALACVNFVNLSTARGANRALEVGVRKAVGSTRAQLFTQFLGETVLLAGISAILALAIAQLTLSIVNSMLISSLQLSAWSIVGAALLALFVGLTAGVYPAVFLSSFAAVQVLKGSGQNIGGRSQLRRSLVTFQFAISVALVIGTLVAWQQTNYIRTRDLGFAKEGLITMPLIKEDRRLREHYESIRDRFETSADVLGATVSLAPPGYENNTDRSLIRRLDQMDSVNVHFLPVDHKFTEVYGIPILEGRPLALTDKDQFKLLLNETAAQALGGVKPGTVLSFFWLREFNFTVVGIFKDFHNSSLHNPVRPLMLIYHPWYDYVTVKVRMDNLPKTLDFLASVWKDFVPAHAFKFLFVDDFLNNFYQGEMRTQTAFTYLSGLAIFVACLGLLGLIAYTTEVRTKEIGVRKVLGASSGDILTLLLREFAVLIIIASLLAWPAAYLFTRSWLDRFAYRIDLSPSVFLIGSLLVLLIAFCTISFQAIRAARANPVDALRYE